MRKTDAEIAGVGGVLRTQEGGGRPGGTNAERNSVLCLEQSQLGPAGGQISRADGARWALLCVAASGADTGRWTSGIVPVQGRQQAAKGPHVPGYGPLWSVGPQA